MLKSDEKRVQRVVKALKALNSVANSAAKYTKDSELNRIAFSIANKTYDDAARLTALTHKTEKKASVRAKRK